MKNKDYIAVILLFMALQPLKLASQIPGSRFNTVEDLFESMLEETEEVGEVTSWLEDLQKLHENPVDVNKAGISELMTIPFLNEVTASAITTYRDTYGDFLSVQELASVPAIGRDMAEKLAFFISVNGFQTSPKKDSISFKRKSRHEFMTRSRQTFPLAAGYGKNEGKPAAFRGSPQTIYLRYGYEKPGSFQAGLTADKDGGESFSFGSGKQGFDFYSGHVSFRINDHFPEVHVGDFTSRTGQGLVLWQGFSLGTSSDIMQASRNMSQTRAYKSTDENNFFRGLSGIYQTSNIRLNLFVSSKKSDGNLAQDSLGKTIFTSLQSTGYHRTTTEIEDRKSVRHSVAGAFVSLYTGSWKIGGPALYEKFQFPFEPGNQLYEKFYFKGKVNFNFSADYHLVTGKYHLFGEAAVSRSGGIAWVQGLEARLHDQLAFSSLFRHFGLTYHATWAGSFATDSRTNGETGWYTGLRILPAAGITLSAYADWHSWPWIKYQTAAPSKGSDYMIEADIRINRRLTGYIRYKNRNREEKTTTGNLRTNMHLQSENLRLHTKYDFRDVCSLAWRFEMSHPSEPVKETGILLSQDLNWTPRKLPLSTAFRFSWFRTPSWDSRIYSYESDLLYAFSTFSFFGEGFRAYLKTRYSFSKSIDAWFKIAVTWLPGKEAISSGYSEIPGNFKTEVKIQFRYRF